MTYNFLSLSSGETAALAQDVPLFVGNSVLDYLVDAQWRVSGSFSSGTNIVASGAPARYAAERQSIARTYPSLGGLGTSQNIYLIVEVVESTADTHAFDSVFVLNHNFHLLAGTITVRLQIDNDPAFASATTIAQWTVSNRRRLVQIGLTGLPFSTRRINNARYLRLWLNTSNAGGFVAAPALGELWLGRRRQLSFFPDVPWDNKATHSDFVDFVSKSGYIVRYTRNRGQRVFAGIFRSGGDDRYGLNQEEQLRSFWDECREGTRQFIFVESPNTEPEISSFVCLEESGRFEMPVLGPFEREIRLAFREVSPYQKREME